MSDTGREVAAVYVRQTARETKQRALDAMAKLVKQVEDGGDREAAAQIAMAMIEWRRGWR